MARSASFIPRYHSNRTSSPWSVVIPPKLSDTGKKQERFFQTKELALGEVQRLKVRKENHGTSAKLLTPGDEQQAVAALKLLRDKGITLQLPEIAGDYISRWEQRSASVPLSQLWEEYEKLMKRNQRSPSHVKSLHFTRDRFEALEDKLVADLTAADIERGLDGASPTYRNSLLVRIRAVLNYGMTGGRKWLAANPAADCEMISRKLGEVQIYSPDEIKSILDTTAELHPELVPAVACMTFAGIRPDILDGEIVKLEWAHVILKDRQKRIELPASITKAGKRRTVTIRPVLASWLQWYKERTKGDDTACKGLVCPVKGQKLRTQLREIYSNAVVHRGEKGEYKLERIQDGLRHSFASYLVPIDGADRVEAELGHGGGREMLNRHYRSDVRAAVAKRFWALRAPKIEKAKLSKIIKFKAA